MSVAACAEMVAKADPDRCAAAMTAPLAAREALFPLYAFNLEIAKAPWVTAEPLIAQMRLQFWRDVLDEADAGKDPRAHEVAAPLAEAIGARAIPLAPLRQMIDARMIDVAREPFAAPALLWSYLENTAGALMQASMAALGAAESDHARLLGRAQGLAAFIAARGELASHGWRAIEDDALPPMIDTALGDLKTLPRRFGAATPAARAAWRTKGLLVRAKQGKALQESEFARRTGLMLRTLTRRA